jgi:hypothetical protein
VADESTSPKDGVGDGDGGGRKRRTLAERREFSNVVLRWSASVNAMRAVVDAFDQSVESLRGTGESLDVLARDRKVAAILKTIATFAEAERRASETRDYLQSLAEYLMAMEKDPLK